jgi:hypothetical protein
MWGAAPTPRPEGLRPRTPNNPSGLWPFGFVAPFGLVGWVRVGLDCRCLLWSFCLDAWWRWWLGLVRRGHFGVGAGAALGGLGCWLRLVTDLGLRLVVGWVPLTRLAALLG